MEPSSTLKVGSRSEWRLWLAEHHETRSEVWLVSDDRPDWGAIEYLDAVEEALCFGWIDGLAKRISEHETA